MDMFENRSARPSTGGGGFGESGPKRRWTLGDDSYASVFYAARPRLLLQQLEEVLLSEEDLDRHGYPRPSGELGVAAFHRLPHRHSEPRLKFVADGEERRHCCRCSTSFRLSRQSSHPLSCRYHFGHLVLTSGQTKSSGVNEQSNQSDKVWDCCGRSEGALGCATAKYHVSDALRDADRKGYVRTTLSNVDVPLYSVLGLDCEMVYTSVGLELARVSLVAVGGRLVYDSLVLPSNVILDCNTRFSGLLPHHFKGLNTRLEDVQRELVDIISSETILVGHSLQTDLRALKICHSRVVDTAVLFPHRKGPFYKRSLRSLAADLLGRKIQDRGSGGHSSYEDANTALDLVLTRLRENARLPLFRL